MRFLVAEIEPAQSRAERRDSVGRSSGETYLALLDRLSPGTTCDRIKPVDADAALPQGSSLASYDGVFLTGSPLSFHEEGPETRRAVAFVRAVFASGVPSFGSCAGLQVATVAAGGRVRPGPGREMGFARRIVPTDAGRTHPLLAGRASAYDAGSIHTDEVEALPADATLLAGNACTPVQAAEIRAEGGTFWGVQYHPELDLGEIAQALRRQADDVVEAGLAQHRTDVESYADRIEALHRAPQRRDLAWQLGLDAQVVSGDVRVSEMRNFIERLVGPRNAAR